MRRVYLVLAVIGLLVPLYFLALFVAENGLNPSLLFDQLFANHVSTFFAADLIITALVFWVFLFQEAARHGIPNAWLFVLLTLVVGPSFAFPLFLYVRESRLAPSPA